VHLRKGPLAISHVDGRALSGRQPACPLRPEFKLAAGGARVCEATMARSG
jgi:hypothetical protein